MIIDRAVGCWLGQLCGDSLGSLVEFRSAERIASEYPEGVHELADGGVWNLLAGQPTDDSEMALMLARTLLREGTYDVGQVLKAYKYWLDSEPFDCGSTCSSGIRGVRIHSSQANGAMMRVSPIGIFGAKLGLDTVQLWAQKDAELTHPNPVCVHSNILYAMAIAQAIITGCSAEQLYLDVLQWCEELKVEKSVRLAVTKASECPPDDYLHQQGWVLIAFQNALWQLLHASSFASAVSDTVGRGGDTDTNGAICGALLGAVHGRAAVPSRWVDKIVNCRPELGQPGVRQPRPSVFWPNDAIELATALVERASKT